MAINLLSKYLPKMQERFQQKSFTAGKAASDYDFVGVKTIRILSMVSNEPVDFNRTGSGNRFGEVSNIQDTMQEMTLTMDKAFTGTIDRGDNSQQGFLKKASQWLKLQQDERMIPMVDKYNLNAWAKNAGIVIDAGAAISKSNIVDKLLDLEVAMDDAGVTPNNRYCYVSNATFKMFRMAAEFVGTEKGANMILQGYKGDLGTLKIISVPASYLPADCVALVATQQCVLAPTTLTTARILETVQGFDGPVIEGRRIFDAFVKGEISDGVVTLAANGKKTAALTISTAGAITVPSSGVDYILYTTDGTNPLYSTTAVRATATVTPSHAAGDTIKAVAFGTGKFHSDVVSVVTAS